MDSFTLRTFWISIVLLGAGMLIPWKGYGQTHRHFLTTSPHNSYSYPSYTFDIQFNWNSPNPGLRCWPGTTAKTEKIKRVDVYGGTSQIPEQTFVFDTEGKIHTSIYNRKIRIEIHNHSDREDLSHTIQYHRNDTLLRLDSIFVFHEPGEGEEGACTCSYQKIHYWKSGKLLNEQNTYYNGKYKGVRIPTDPPYGSLGVQYLKPKGKLSRPVYFKKSFKTDYAEEEMFKEKIFLACDGWACGACCEKYSSEYFLEGASFSEPIYMKESHVLWE